MRNKRTIVGIVAVLISALVASIAWAAPGDTVQTIKGTIAPNKLPKKKLKPASVNVVTTTGVEGEDGNTDPALRPSPAERAVITFDKDIKFNTNAAPRCNANLNGTSTEAAKKACRRSQVGAGKAQIAIGTGANRFDATVTAFNGPKVGGKGSIILHSRVDTLGTTALLNGVLKGQKLDVEIPEIANGQGSVMRFQTKVRKGTYVRAKCPDKKFNYKGVFSYEDGTSKTATSKQTCRGTRR